jgi:hypothetical protein
MLVNNPSPISAHTVKIKNRNIKMRAAILNTTMKPKFKVAPLSCHCKLSVLIPHLKSLAAQQSQTTRKRKPINNIDSSELLFKRYI